MKKNFLILATEYVGKGAVLCAKGLVALAALGLGLSIAQDVKERKQINKNCK